MDVFTKSIRKLMGWCPNTKTLETRHSICPNPGEEMPEILLFYLLAGGTNAVTGH